MKQWFETDTYDQVSADTRLAPYWGPEGPAIVKVFDNDKTQAGWGEADFMRNYKLGKFRQAVHNAPFAYVMRSFFGLVVDIDGKNDGINNAKQLNLPPTLTETSKSGNGYHLWYTMPVSHMAVWDDDKGFATLSDRIGLVKGVDIRVTGCVFHYPQQLWNSVHLQPAPGHLINKIMVRESMSVTPARVKELIASDDQVEIKRLVNEALTSLEKPIPHGRRNQTLFAIGSQLYLLDFPGWEGIIRKAGEDNDLDSLEVEKIIRNVPNYAERT